MDRYKIAFFIAKNPTIIVKPGGLNENNLKAIRQSSTGSCKIINLSLQLTRTSFEFERIS